MASLFSNLFGGRRRSKATQTERVRERRHEGFLRYANFRWAKISGGLCLLIIVSYAMVDVTPRHNGGSWYGYTLGTLGAGLTQVKPAQGFAAETSTAATILASSHLGYALSTTQVASGSVIGSGLGRRGSKVRWGTVGRIAIGLVSHRGAPRGSASSQSRNSMSISTSSRTAAARVTVIFSPPAGPRRQRYRFTRSLCAAPWPPWPPRPGRVPSRRG